MNEEKAAHDPHNGSADQNLPLNRPCACEYLTLRVLGL